MEKYFEKIQEIKAVINNAATEAEKETGKAELETITKEIAAQGEYFSKVYKRYEASHEKGNNLLNLNSGDIWPREVADLAKAFKENGIREFTLTSHCTNTNEIAWEFIKNGYNQQGMTLINTSKKFFEDGYDQEPAFIFRIS